MKNEKDVCKENKSLANDELSKVAGGVAPKRITSKAKKRGRRSSNWKMKAPGVSTCPNCGEAKLPHRVCPSCGYYDGKITGNNN